MKNGYKALQRQIAQSRAYELNGCPETEKRLYRGIRKGLEGELDKQKLETRANYMERNWN